MSERLRAWAPDAALALAVLVAGVLEVWAMTVPFDHSRYEYALIVLGFAVACGLSRKAPFAALALVWVTCALQLLAGTGVITVEFAVAIVAFGCARWGHPFTVVVSGLSIPAAAVVGYVIVTQASMGVFRDLSVFRELQDSAYRFSDTLLVGATILGLLVLAVPWLAGLVVRASVRARRSEVQTERAEADAARAQRDSEQAREIARLQEDQARMARDVHDVVGHSLAVILAQAESGQFLPDDDPEALKRTMATIAGSARSSLQDVRQVLAGPADPAPANSGAFDDLLEGVRAAGHDVQATEIGQPVRCHPSSTWRRTAWSRRCSPTRSSTAAATARCRWSATGPRGPGTATCGSRCATSRSRPRCRGRGRDPADAGGGSARSGPRRDAPAARVGRRPARRTPPGGRRRGDVHGHRLDTGERPMTGPAAGAEIRVLLVDDQDLFREGVKVIVDAQPGMTVVGSAGDGLEAVRLVDELEPDVVLMDIRMPEMDGVEATRQIFGAERVASSQSSGAGRGADDLQPRRPGRDGDPLRCERLPAQGHDPGAAAGRHPDRLRRQRGPRPGGPVSAARPAVPAPVAPPAAYAVLTDKEKEVFDAVASGLSNTEIATRVFASESTVKTHVGAILRKLALRDRVQIVVFAHEHGLVRGGAGE